MSQPDVAAALHFRATLWSAIIGGVAVIIAAIVGVALGRNQGADQRIDLSKELKERDAVIAKQKLEIARLTRPNNGDEPSASAAGARDSEQAKLSYKSGYSVTQEGFRFDLIQCYGLYNTITCDFGVTSLGRQRELIVAVQPVGGIRRAGIQLSRAVDHKDRNHVGSLVTISDQTNPDDGQLLVRLAANVPALMTIKFENVESPVSYWSLVELAAAAGSRPFTVRFRKVDIGW
jgi:hypothetical protein